MATSDTPHERAFDPATAITEELAGLDDRPVAEHVAVLERVNATIAAELAALDEV